MDDTDSLNKLLNYNGLNSGLVGLYNKGKLPVASRALRQARDHLNHRRFVVPDITTRCLSLSKAAMRKIQSLQ